MTSVKTVLGSVGAFLAHHIDDLRSVGAALTALVNAVPVNSGTKDHIRDAINTVEKSAANIEAFLETVSGDGGVPTVTINESDIAKAVSAQVSAYLSENLPSLVAHAVGDYMRDNPVTPADGAETKSAKK